MTRIPGTIGAGGGVPGFAKVSISWTSIMIDSYDRTGAAIPIARWADCPTWAVKDRTLELSANRKRQGFLPCWPLANRDEPPRRVSASGSPLFQVSLGEVRVYVHGQRHWFLES
jgi:hypothetical protein